MAVSISNITETQGGKYYYEKDPLFGHNSSWFGKMAEMMGLGQGAEVSKNDFIAVLKGTDPRNGEELVQSNGFGEHRAGTDITLSCPKSFSFLATTQDERLVEVFKNAVDTSLSFLEENIVQGRKSVDGEKVRVDTGSSLFATYYHSTSRAAGAELLPDMQLHAHSIMANLTVRDDGKIVAVENRSIFQNQQLLDTVFKTELAAGVRELGYQVITDERGNFEIAGVPQAVIENFSKRAAQIDAKAEELRETTFDKSMSEPALREQANLLSRQSKKAIDGNTLQADWDRQLESMGLTREEVLQSARNAGMRSDRSPDEKSASDYIRSAAESILENESTFTKANILKAAGILAMGAYRVTDLEQAFGREIDSKSLVQLDGKEEGLSGIYTTSEMQKIERTMVSMIKNGQGRAEPLMTAGEAEKAIGTYIESHRGHDQQFDLTNSQKHAITDVLTSDSKYLVIQGGAGAGKSKAVEVVNQALSVYAQKDIELVGLAYTGKASQELEKSSGVASQTLSRFLLESLEDAPRSNDEIPRKERMYIVDEASMLSSRDAHQLFQQAERDGSKVVLIGDVKQLLAIGQGRLFSDIQTKNIIDVTTMDEVIRQKTEEMKELVADISARKIDSAFDRMERNDRIHEISDRGELVRAITQEYVNRENWRDTLVLSSTNVSRKELNLSIRHVLQEKGEIGSEDIALTVRSPKSIPAVEKHFSQSYSENDYVFATKAGGGMKAGVVAKVIGVDQESHTLTLRDSENNFRLYDVKKHGDKLSAYSESSDFMVSEGQKILFLKNDKKLGVQNGLADAITYQYSPKQYDALYGFTTGTGNCQNFSHLALALLRASGIPARIAVGQTLKDKWKIPLDDKGSSLVQGMGEGLHAWIEVYYADQGWLPCDPMQSRLFTSTRHIKLAHGLDAEDMKDFWSGIPYVPQMSERITATYLNDVVSLKLNRVQDNPKNYQVAGVVSTIEPKPEPAPVIPKPLPVPPKPKPVQETKKPKPGAPIEFGNRDFPALMDIYQVVGDIGRKSFERETAEYATSKTLYAQAFTLDMPLALKDVSLAMHKFGGDGTIYIDVVKDDGGKPSLDGIRSMPVPLDQIGQKPGYYWVDFTMPKDIKLAKGKHWILLRHSGEAIMNWFYTHGRKTSGPDDTRSTARGWEWEDVLAGEFVYSVRGLAID